LNREHYKNWHLKNKNANFNQGEKMYKTNKTTTVLGFAFLFQFVTSLSSGVFLKSVWFVSGDMGKTMLKIANNQNLFRANILVDMLTAFGVAILGIILFLTLRKENEKIALIAMAFYMLEGALLAASRMEAFSLLQLSQSYAATGQPAVLLMMGTLAYESMNFSGLTLHMLAFCPGGIMFYALLYRSGAVPRVLSLWGLITVFPMLVGTVTEIFGNKIPSYFYYPYVPFELVIGIWVLVKGIRIGSEKGNTKNQQYFELKSIPEGK
jgi:hypothetical protein